MATPDTSDTLPALTQNAWWGPRCRLRGHSNAATQQSFLLLPDTAVISEMESTACHFSMFQHVSTSLNTRISIVFGYVGTPQAYFSAPKQSHAWNLRFCRISIAVRMHCLGQCHAQRNLASENPTNRSQRIRSLISRQKNAAKHD